MKERERLFVAEKAHIRHTSMAQHGNRNAMILQRIEALTKQYEEGLKNGTEFHELKQIRDQLKSLKKSINADPSHDTPGYKETGLPDPPV